MSNNLPIARSPDRGSFQRKNYLERIAKAVAEDKPSAEIAEITESLKLVDDMWRQRMEREQDPNWQKNNLEYDLRTTPWIIEKVRASRVYAQNLYAAMCNRDFRKIDVLEILKESTWGCSWRSAGGIVADIRGSGDYIDWYCSGIRNAGDLDDESYNSLSKEQQEQYLESRLSVGEGTVSEEIRNDLKQLGWLILPDADLD
jgi:hypothetical protein